MSFGACEFNSAKCNKNGRFQAEVAGDARGMASFRFEITNCDVKSWAQQVRLLRVL
jgi:hypothetical protein